LVKQIPTESENNSVFATALDEFIITLLQYADFLGLFGGMTLSGSVIFNHVIIDAFRVAGFLLVMIGIFQVLSGKTTQKNELDNRTNACITSEEASCNALLNNKKRVERQLHSQERQHWE
jgi:small neutral amino acid transporter SnatA (MarC family)